MASSPSSPPRILYIAGRGQSGSTMLDVILGHSPDVTNVGEVVSGLNRGDSELCSCGRQVGECEFWSAVADRQLSAHATSLFDDARWLYAHSDFRRLGSAVLGRGETSMQYRRRNRRLMASIGHVGQTAVICDSNKEFSRAAETLGAHEEHRVVHLYRDPVSVVASMYYRVKTRRMPLKVLKREFFPTSLFLPSLYRAVAWNVGFFAGLFMEWRYPGRVLRVRYEDLVDRPHEVVAEIGEFAGIDVAGILRTLSGDATFPTKHSVGGNFLRESGEFQIVRNVEGRRELPRRYRLLVRFVTAPVALLSRRLDGRSAR